jgi:hypothetical protein
VTLGRCAAAAALCCGLAAQALALDLAVSQQQQSWREWASDGRRLVDESGPLRGLSAAQRWSVGEATSIGVAAGAHWGQRDYDGLSSRGQPVQTRSDIAQQMLRVDGATAMFGDRWQSTAALEFWQWRRRLRGTDTAAGYPERYRQGLALLGVRWSGEPTSWQARAELAWGSGGRNRVALPGRDEASLPLGRVHGWRLQARSPSWQGLWVGAGLERLDFAAGEVRPITLQGVTVQAANQPRTALSRLELQLGWTP